MMWLCSNVYIPGHSHTGESYVDYGASLCLHIKSKLFKKYDLNVRVFAEFADFSSATAL